MPEAPETPSPAFLFRRPTLAVNMADSLMGRGAFDRSAGLFLAAPRRTGKTTFVAGDLLTELQSRGVIVVYVDLWSDRQRDPAELINEALKTALRGLDGAAARTIRKAGLTKAGIGSWLSFDIDRVGAPDGPSLTEVLRSIILRAGKPVALLVDEAQDALASDAGVDAMFALKAARDALNRLALEGSALPPPRLMLVFTGSHRDKLAHLVIRRDQPFFGADIADFARLGRDFSDAYCAWLNRRLAADNGFSADDVWLAFQAVGHRPELLKTVLEAAALSEAGAGSLRAVLANDASALRKRLWDDFESEWAALSPLQRSVLKRIAREGAAHAPYSAASLAAHASGVGAPVSAADVQAAITAVRGRNLVWQSGRANYALEDQEMAEWLVRQDPPI